MTETAGVRITVSVVTIGVISICSLLWTMSLTLTQIQTSLAYIEKTSGSHTISLVEQKNDIQALDTRVTILEAQGE